MQAEQQVMWVGRDVYPRHWPLDNAVHRALRPLAGPELSAQDRIGYTLRIWGCLESPLISRTGTGQTITVALAEPSHMLSVTIDDGVLLSSRQKRQNRKRARAGLPLTGFSW